MYHSNSNTRHMVQFDIAESTVTNRRKKKNEPRRIAPFSGSCLVNKCWAIVIGNIIGFLLLGAIGAAIGLSISGTTRKTFGQLCAVNTDCKNLSSYGLICNNGICGCMNSAYYESETCAAKKDLNMLCTASYQCDNLKNLACINKNGVAVCGCDSNRYWNETICVTLGLHNATCSSTSQCNTLVGLNCTSNTCSCNSSSYWTGSFCDPIKSINDLCMSNSSCNASQLLYCAAVGYTPATCSCPDFYFWNNISQTCSKQASVNGTCSSNSQCRNDLGLGCGTTSTCNCYSNYYWSSTNATCLPVSSINQTCSTQIPCDTSLLLTCQNNICQCPSTNYWDGFGCALKKTIGSTCTSAVQCATSAGLICNVSVCMCLSTQFWNGVYCEDKYVSGIVCNNTVQCQDYNLLTCVSGTPSSTCQCAYTHYWNGNLCVPKLDQNATCVNVTMCKSYLGLNCINSVCNCTNLDYYNGIKCVSKKTFNVTCGSSYECNDNVGLSCKSSICDCAANYYFDGTQCASQLLYQKPCTSSYQCYGAGQLSCINSVCDCPLPISQKMYWVPALMDCKILPKSCKEILQQNPGSQSGIYYLASSVGLLEAYCEMVIDGGGYTFLPWSSLSAATGMLKDIYTDQSKVLYRFISRSNTNDQPYVLTKQLSQYSYVPISIQENANVGYNSPTNVGRLGNYIYVGFIPQSMIYTGFLQGWEGNGNPFSFTNCDGNPNSYTALYANLYPTATNLYSSPGSVIGNWKASALTHPSLTFMPGKYYYFIEIHKGGCGGYEQSDQWSDYFGAAIGMI